MKTRVLLVDDEQQFVEQLSERLKFRDYDVSICFSGEEAVENIKQYIYDVVILDVSMPGIDGNKALKRIKELRPLTEVIMLTGHATVESAIDGMKQGAFDYLMKPCDTNELIAKINNARQRKTEQEERIRAAKAKRYSTSPWSALEDK
ncbi:MAG: response regulator [Desulfobacteraceae bacterium]|nr:response regulator [Desulfobacteraceae bacterium]